MKAIHRKSMNTSCSWCWLQLLFPKPLYSLKHNWINLDFAYFASQLKVFFCHFKTKTFNVSFLTTRSTIRKPALCSTNRLKEAVLFVQHIITNCKCHVIWSEWCNIRVGILLGFLPGPPAESQTTLMLSLYHRQNRQHILLTLASEPMVSIHYLSMFTAQILHIIIRFVYTLNPKTVGFSPEVIYSELQLTNYFSPFSF